MREDFERLGPAREQPNIFEVEPMADLSFNDGPLQKEYSDILDVDKRLILEPRNMSFSGMSELLAELVETKAKADIKNLQTRTPKRTMEAHLHEVFKTKFGLKKLITENLLSFIHTLKGPMYYFLSFNCCSIRPPAAKILLA